VGENDAEKARPKRARRNTPAEDDLAATRAKASLPAMEQATASGPRPKKTGRA